MGTEAIAHNRKGGPCDYAPKNRFQKSFMLKGYASIMAQQNMIEFVKSIPGQLIMIIIGFVLMVNSNHTDIILKANNVEAEQLLADNMELVGRVLIVLGIVKILIMWYLAHVADQSESADENKIWGWVVWVVDVERIVNQCLEKYGSRWMKTSQIVLFGIATIATIS